MCLPSLSSIYERLFPLTDTAMVSSTCTWPEGSFNYNIGFTTKKRRRYSPSPFAGYGGRRTR
jgi:hypothetical protein